jgi:Macrocin-O-methyltransferase (TylF)
MARIAYGCSKLLRFFLNCGEPADRQFDYVVDQGYAGSEFCGLPVVRPPELEARKMPGDIVYVFAVSNSALNSILSYLAGIGFRLGANTVLYSEFFREEFRTSVALQIGWDLDYRLLEYSTAYTLNSRKPIHTTICGTWLFLEILRRVGAGSGQIAEVGAFEGGNALCALQSPVWPQDREYYIFDSFEGFPELSNRDPSAQKAGDYQTTKSYEEILIPFTPYPQAKFIRGFVPDAFSHVPPSETFSMVFYDCDLYQPALATFEFFWDRMNSGAAMVVHDYFAEPNGFTGVRDACAEFFGGQTCKKAEFWQNTMAVFFKP